MDRRPLDRDALRARLGDRWGRIEVVEVTGSTNTDLLDDSGAPDRSVLVAEHQVAGLGRLGRVWQAPAGSGLTFSVLLRAPAPPPALGWLPLLTGLAVREAVAAVDVDAVLKWPNDVLAGAGGAKLAGVLVQGRADLAVVGIGLNVSLSAAELPVPTATSLALCGSGEVDRAELLVAILTGLDRLLGRWAAGGHDAQRAGLAAEYTAVCDTLGREVTVTATGGANVEGRAERIAPDGRLALLTAAGEQLISAGDVTHLRPLRSTGDPSTR